MTKNDIDLSQFVCPRCGGELTNETGQVSPGYVCACTACDEDFLTFELDRVADLSTSASVQL